MWRGVAGATVAGTLACLGSTASYGATFAYVQRFFAGRSGSAAALSAQLVGGSVELAVVAPARARRLPHWPGAPAAVALLALGALGTGLAYVLNLGVIRAAGPTVASTVTYVIPVWSTTIGAVLLAEPVGWNTVVGVSWWLLGSSSPASPTGPEGGGCATGPAPRSRSVSFGAPCRAFVTLDGIVPA